MRATANRNYRRGGECAAYLRAFAAANREFSSEQARAALKDFDPEIGRAAISMALTRMVREGLIRRTGLGYYESLCVDPTFAEETPE